MMRHLLLTATMAAALMLAACSAHDDGADHNGVATGEVISFEAEVSDATRGTAVNSITDLQAAGTFRVWAWMHDDRNILYPMTSDYNSSPLLGVDVTYSAAKNAWQTDQTYYWPRPRYTVDFYAVSPADNDKAPFNTTAKTIDFTSASITGNTDVMYAAYQGSRTSTDTKTGQPVPLHFRHALSRIAFSGILTQQVKDFGWTVDVSGITINNVNARGYFALTPKPDNADGTPATATMTVTPANPATLTDYPLTMAATSVAVSSTTDAVALTSATDVTMLMPQTLTAWTPAAETGGTTIATNNSGTKGCYLTIQLHITDASGKDVTGTAATPATVYVPFNGVTGSWEAATRYNYTLRFGGGYDAQGQPVIQPITITAAIQPWQTTATTGTATHPTTN